MDKVPLLEVRGEWGGGMVITLHCLKFWSFVFKCHNFVQQPTLKPIYPLHNSIPVIPADESDKNNKDDEMLDAEPRIVPDTRNLTKLKG